MAILLFTVIIKIVLMPLSLWCQWNSIVMVKIMPELNRIKVKYFGDAETIGEKQTLLNKKHHYHPLLSLIPLAAQILVLFGLVEVIHGITDHGAPGTEFLGMVPIEDGGLSWIMPLLAGLSAVVMGFAQNRINPLQREQSKMEKNTTNGLSIVLSLVLGVYVAAGMAFYWICSNLMAIVVQALCNLIMRPAKYIDYAELAASRVELDELNAFTARKTPWYKRDPLAKREKEDYRRFMSVVGKHIVFYSERSGFYKYFQGAVEWLLANSDACVHYVTSDPNDQVFKLHEANPRLMPYYIGDKRLITLMMKLDCDVAVMTLDDLENFYIKRSYIRKDIEYVYAFHHMTSTHLVCTKEAFDHYDTVLCVGPHQKAELERAGEMRDIPRRNLVECGYDLLDRQIAAYESVRRRGARALAGTRVQRDRASASRVHQALSRPVGVAAAALRVVVARRHLLRAGLQHVRFGLRCRRAGHRLVLHRLRVLLHHDEAVRVRGHAHEGDQPRLGRAGHRARRSGHPQSNRRVAGHGGAAAVGRCRGGHGCPPRSLAEPYRGGAFAHDLP